MPDRPRPETRCKCGHALQRFWRFCPACARRQVWHDTQLVTGAECRRCGWVVSERGSFCPWCRTDLHEDGVSSARPLRRPKGFRLDARCDAGCGGGVQYPMAFCPWCGQPQSWDDAHLFDGVCPRCDRGVDDWMDTCPWCGQDATGRDLIAPAERAIRRLLRITGIADWGFRLLLRPGGSGVAPDCPKIVAINRSHVLERRRRAEVPWPMLVGLVAHELGHSFLFHHWRWTRSPRFRRVFGEVDKAYRVDEDTPVYFDRRRVAYAPVAHVSAYASTHPLEDFAETFRIYLTRRRRLRELFAELGRKRKAVKVFEKFLLLHDYVRSLRGWS
jgi:hypothetical protein